MIVTDASGPPPPAGPGVVQVGLHEGGPLPTEGLGAYDILLSLDPETSAPWVGVPAEALAAKLHALDQAIARQPLAAGLAAQVLRLSLTLPFEEALTLESLAYSTLLGSAPFRAWRAATPVRAREGDDGPRVRIAEDDGILRITLTRPAVRNAFDARMRDELCEALAFAAEHPDQPPVTLDGEGPSFSAGGDLDEFGAGDPGVGHLIRTLRAPVRQARALGARLTVRVHGACVGAGLEVPAAAARVTAREGATFRLPEVSMGLIPGAGGTASIPRRIGRHRACYMAISGAEIDLRTALAWRLVDETAT